MSKVTNCDKIWTDAVSCPFARRASLQRDPVLYLPEAHPAYVVYGWELIEVPVGDLRVHG